MLDITILSSITLGVVEALKRAFKIDNDFIPLVGLIVSFVLGGIGSFFGLTNLSIWESLVAGLMAMGLWDTGKKVNKIRKLKK